MAFQGDAFSSTVASLSTNLDLHRCGSFVQFVVNVPYILAYAELMELLYVKR